MQVAVVLPTKRGLFADLILKKSGFGREVPFFPQQNTSENPPWSRSNQYDQEIGTRTHQRGHSRTKTYRGDRCPGGPWRPPAALGASLGPSSNSAQISTSPLLPSPCPRPPIDLVFIDGLRAVTGRPTTDTEVGVGLVKKKKRIDGQRQRRHSIPQYGTSKSGR